MEQRRFYEANSTVKQAIDSLFLFPADTQQVIAKGFSTIAERDCNAAELLREFKNLGTERVLALYKSKRKQRKYDANPAVHNAMNYLLVMNEESRVFLAEKVIELVEFMQAYLKLCKTYASNPQLSTVETIAEAYVEYGPDEAKTFIETLEVEFHKHLTQTTKPAPKKVNPVSVREGIESQSGGMRIKGDLLR